MIRVAVLVFCLLWCGPLPGQKLKLLKKADPQPSALDQYVESAHRRAAAALSESPGSLWAGPATLADIASDVRARSVDDIVTIVVNEQASAVATGQTKTSRASNANASVTSALGALSAASRFANPKYDVESVAHGRWHHLAALHFNSYSQRPRHRCAAERIPGDRRV